MDFWERIRLIIDTEGVSINKFEELIGASQGVIAKCIRNKTDISAKWVIAIKDIFPRYSLDWLLVGNGQMTIPEEQPIDNTFAMEVIREKDKKIEELIRDNERKEQELSELKKRYSTSTVTTMPTTASTSTQIRK